MRFTARFAAFYYDESTRRASQGVINYKDFAMEEGSGHLGYRAGSIGEYAEVELLGSTERIAFEEKSAVPHLKLSVRAPTAYAFCFRIMLDPATAP